jgi:peptide deformylase
MPVDPALLKLLIYPAKALRQSCVDVDPSDAQVAAVARTMIDLMHEHEGIGLAAPQVGLPWRVFVTRGEEEDLVRVNPVIEVLHPAVEVNEEGCLSLPGVRVDVARPVSVVMRSLDLSGNVHEEVADDFMGRVWQHERDHLDGVLIIDRMGPMDRLANRRQLRSLEREA